MERPTLRQLEYFSALAARLNFREAAESCFVTQPALSGQIAQLESLWGVRLFERDKKSVRLTSAGAQLLGGAREILRRTDELGELTRSFGAPLSGPLRLGTIPTVGPYLLPKVLPAVQKAYPELRLYLREDLTPRLLERLDAGDLDLLLLAIDVPLGKVATKELFSDPFFVAVPEGDPLAKLEQIELADIAEREVLLLEEGHCLRDQTVTLCEAAGSDEVPGFRGTSLGTVTQMVASGLGLTLLPELAVERESATTPGLATLPFGSQGPDRRIGLAWRSSSPRSKEFELLGETILAAYLA